METEARNGAVHRLQLVELLMSAIDRRDEVFEVVAAAADRDEASVRIGEMFGVDAPYPSMAVLDLQVFRWTRSERERIGAEADELRRLLGRADGS